MRKPATNPIKDHPLVARLNRSIELDEKDLAALAGLLERRTVVKKAKDILVEGYTYRVLHIVESGFGVFFGARQRPSKPALFVGRFTP